MVFTKATETPREDCFRLGTDRTAKKRKALQSTIGGYITPEYLKETLDLYKEEYIYLKSAKITDSGIIVGSFEIADYTFTKHGYIEYITAPMLSLLISQIGFVLVRILCENDLLGPGINISTDSFFHIRDSGNIVITELNRIRFSKKIYLSISPIQVKLRLLDKTVINNNLVGNCFFSIGHMEITGNVQVVALLNK